MTQNTNTEAENLDPTQDGGGAILQRLVSPIYVYSDHLKDMGSPVTVKCLHPQHALTQGKALEAEGWVHTATLEPAKWIECLCNGYERPEEMIRSLQTG